MSQCNIYPIRPGAGTLSSLDDGGGIVDFSFDGRYDATVQVDDTVVRTSGDQIISGEKSFVDHVIIKDLTVTGVQYIEHARDLYVGDPLITLNSGVSNPNTYDIGWIGDRGNGTINVANMWDESADQFALVSTADDGSTLGNVAITSYESLKINSLYATGDIHVENTGDIYLKNNGRLKWEDTDGQSRATIWVNPSDELRLTNNSNNDGGDIVFATKALSQPSMRINSAGEVGIGTNNPSGSLHVSGAIYTDTGYIDLGNGFEKLDCAATKTCEYFTGTMFGIPYNTGDVFNDGDLIRYNSGSNYWESVPLETGCAATKTCEYFTGTMFGIPYNTGDVFNDGDILQYNSAQNYWESKQPDTANPGGVNTNVQFNDGGAFGGNAGLSYNKTTYTLSANGDVVAYASSDERLKENVTNISDPIEKINQLNGVEFDWSADAYDHLEGHDIGVIAQDVQKALPEAVKVREDGMLAVRYEKMVPLLIECVKDQQKQIDELKALIHSKGI